MEPIGIIFLIIGIILFILLLIIFSLHYSRKKTKFDDKKLTTKNKEEGKNFFENYYKNIETRQ